MMRNYLLFLLIFAAINGQCSVTERAQSGLKPGTGTNADSSFNLSFMTWNVEMLPRMFFFLHHKPVIRARIIPRHLLEDKPDVIVFQEAFDLKAVRILKRKMKKVYPYVIGPANRKALGFKINSGVMIMSKLPMREIETIRYSNCAGDDCFARKGALLVEMEANGRKFQLLGTHMQAGGTKEIKSSQYQQAGDLLRRHTITGEPQVICGDFNTFQSDTSLYPLMIKNLEAENGPFTGALKYTSDHLVNDLCDDLGKPNCERDVIDYILYRSNGNPFKKVMRRVIEYLQPWHKKHKYLSDHNAVLMQVKW